MEQNVYKENGHNSRREYLECLAADFDVPLVDVLMLADILGPDEDFDGLVTAIEDYAERGFN